MTTIEPTIPFHLARAYGVKPPVQAVRAIAPTTPGTSPRTSSVTAPEPSVADASGGKSAVATIRERLVAVVVPGRVDFSGSEPAQSMSLYHHPADRNAAATGVQAGRVVDVTG